MSDYSKNIKDRVQFVCICLIDVGIDAGCNIPSERDLVIITGFSRPKLRELFAVLDYIGVTDSSHGKARVLKGGLRKVVRAVN